MPAHDAELTHVGPGTPTFPRARYLFARREWEHWSAIDGDEYGEYGTHFASPTAGHIVRAGCAWQFHGDGPWS